MCPLREHLCSTRNTGNCVLGISVLGELNPSTSCPEKPLEQSYCAQSRAWHRLLHFPQEFLSGHFVIFSPLWVKMSFKRHHTRP